MSKDLGFEVHVDYSHKDAIEKVMEKDFKYILKNTVEKALDGDMSATKMLMDRVIPVGKAVDLNDNKGTPKISINIGSLVKEQTKVVSEQ